MPSFLPHLPPRHRTLRLSLPGKVFGIAAAIHVSAEDAFFRDQVEPILRERCYECQPESFCTWMAGGGIKGGLMHGETDEFGFRPISGKVHLHDLHATILHLLGLDHEQLTWRHQGRDFRLTDVYGEVVREILA